MSGFALRRSLQCGALSAAMACIAGSTAGQAQPAAAGAVVAAGAAVARVYAACVAAMVQSTCSVQNDRSRRAAARPGEVVFVAGVGAIDAAGYRQLQAYGASMCSHVRQACTTAPNGAQCRTATRLWGS
ncbi:MAG TPA: hypothetical protein VKI18_10800 [Albitalea sp.]|nr:hypothetical protein [Albitalea sp.]